MLVLATACQSSAPKQLFFQADRFEKQSDLQEELRSLIFARQDLSIAAPSDREAWLAYGERLKSLADSHPDEVLVQRQRDDFERTRLRGPGVWEARQKAYSKHPMSEQSYLLGRLERPKRAQELFSQAVDLDPNFALGLHGIAWLANQAGASQKAEHFGRMAAARAKNSIEALVVGQALAHFRRVAGEVIETRELYAQMGALPGLSSREVASMRAKLVASRLLSPNFMLAFSGPANGDSLSLAKRLGNRDLHLAWLEALQLLEANSDLADADVIELVNAIDAADLSRSESEKLGAILVALRGRKGAKIERLNQGLVRGLRILDLPPVLRPSTLVSGSMDSDQLEAAFDFEKGRVSKWLVTWRRRLPARLKNLKLEEEARPGSLFASEAMVSLTQDPSLDKQPNLELLGSLFLEVGWFRLAHLLALQEPSSSDLKLVQIEAGRLLVAELGQLLENAKAGHFKQLSGPNGVLGGIAEVAARFVPALDARTSEALSPAAIVSSSRETYGPFAAFIRPGPRQAPSKDSEPLPGFAALTDQLGRMAIVGSQIGRLDATMRPVIAKQYLSGSHLGAPFGGTAFWCQGVDVPSRFESAGARIAGAAVHDGFWIDIEVVRDLADTWQALGKDFAFLTLASGELFPAAPSCSPDEANRLVPLLGEGRRLMLRLIAERGPATFDELIDLVSIHEEAHLCDRARFLPLRDNWRAALALFSKVGFKPQRLIQRLEYRAELVTLCEAEDPRLVLAEILTLAESAEANASASGTAHGAAYSNLLTDLAKYAAPALDPQRYIRWQWHQIDAKDLRSAALQLAASEGLIVSH